MTRRKQILLKLLALILAALAAAGVIRLALNYRDSRRAAAQAAAQENAAAPQSRGYTSLTYSNGSATLRFALDETDTWTWADDPDFPLDDTTVTTILGLVTDLKFQQTLPNEAGLEEYGLDDPIATLTASGDEEVSSLTLDLGKTTTDGDSYYILLNGDESTVYIIADTLYQQMCVSIYDMAQLPELPVLTEDNIEIISIQGEALTTIRAIRPEGEKNEKEADPVVTWRSSGANVTSSPSLSALLTELGDLHFAKCVDYRPSDDAAGLCGFAEPTLNLSVIYLSEGGAEQTLLLTLGSVSLDGAGYYARMNDDPSIYQLDSTSISALLEMAASGLN